MSEPKNLNLFQKINLVMSRVSSVYKGTSVDMGNGKGYFAVSHDDVSALLHNPITEARLVAMPNMVEASVETYETKKEYNGKVTVSSGYLVKVWASVTFINIDKPEEQFTTKCYAYAIDSGDKATGKAYSMAIKYCYLKTFMLESSDEEEQRHTELPSTHASHIANPSNNKQRPADPGVGSTLAKLATAAQISAIKNLYPLNELEKIDPSVLTYATASDMIKNAKNNRK